VIINLEEYDKNYDKKLYVAISRIARLSDLMLIEQDLPIEYYMPPVE